MRVTTPVQMRFADVDSFNHVNNIAQQAYYDLGKIDLLQALWQQAPSTQGISAIIVSSKSDYVSQIYLGDKVEVMTRLTKVGTKSIELEQQIMRGEEECSRCSTVMVCIDSASRTAIEAPDEWRKMIE